MTRALNFALKCSLSLSLSLAPSACSSDEPVTKDDDAATVPSERVPREAWNEIAVELFEPIVWRADDDGDGAISPSELAVLERSDGPRWEDFVDGEAFTPRATEALARIAAVHAGGHAKLTDDDARRRREANLKELRQGKPTLVYTDVRGEPPQTRAFVEKMLTVARVTEALHARQLGVAELAGKVPVDDTIARAIFERNQGPSCVAPLTEADPACGALSPAPARVSGLYPKGIQASSDFCDMLAAREDAAELLAPFTVVVEDTDGALRAEPYHVFFKDDMARIASLLDEARQALDDPNEDALRAYLAAAANAFRTGDWPSADEAWSRMSVSNSAWYLRVGPDEVYFEPCSRKAGFHVSFARINQASVTWQTKLDPLKGDMERALAALAGAPYEARDVAFHLPDFIDIVVNAGDARSPHGATIGQSLPNWGAVADEGRGRTVAMTNLYTDEDSKETLRAQAASLFCDDTMALFDTDPAHGTLSTVLHEAAHNLGPSHSYRAFGKTDDEAFGGPLASTMEELKAQTSALYLSGWLVERGALDAEHALKTRVRDLAWMFGHISRGMTSADGRPKPYSQLSAIQLGSLIEAGAVTWSSTKKAQNGADTGCFDVDRAKLPGAIDALSRVVLGAKARGDRPAAEALLTRFVVEGNPHQAVFATVAERWLRADRASFVYAVRR